MDDALYTLISLDSVYGSTGAVQKYDKVNKQNKTTEKKLSR